MIEVNSEHSPGWKGVVALAILLGALLGGCWTVEHHKTERMRLERGEVQ